MVSLFEWAHHLNHHWIHYLWNVHAKIPACDTLKYGELGVMIMVTSTQTKNEQLLEQLNKQVANFGLLYFKLHHYHWYVKGTEFFTLHSKFEELYDEINQYYDALAERILALGGSPASTMAQTLRLSSLQEAGGNETAAAMVKQLSNDFSVVCDELKTATAEADQMDDQPTADMLTSMRQSLEKTIWMLAAFTG